MSFSATGALPHDRIPMEGPQLRAASFRKAWYVAQLKPNGFAAACRNLKQQGFETFMPMREATVRHARANRLVRRPLFPGYLFVGVDPEVARWRSINSTFGVNRLITTRSNHPQSVPISLMRELLLGCDERDLVLPPVQLSVGDQVRVVEGPFKNIVASVAKASDSQRIALLLEIMGRATRVKIANKDVELVRAV